MIIIATDLCKRCGEGMYCWERCEGVYTNYNVTVTVSNSSFVYTGLINKAVSDNNSLELYTLKLNKLSETH